MKIVLLIPHLSGGGGEKVLSDLASGLSSHDLLLVVFEKKFDYPFKGRTVSLDLTIRRNSLTGRAGGFLRRILRFRSLLKKEKPDVVVSFMGEANLINVLCSRRPIITVHNHISSTNAMDRIALSSALIRLRKRLETKLSESLMRLLYRRATVIAVAESIRKELAERFGVSEHRITVIHNAVDAREIQQKASETVTLPWNPDAPTIITA